MEKVEDELEKADNLNDRYNLILLKLKRDRNKEENKELQKLIIAYPDYAIFERRIIYKLQKRGFIDTTNSEGHEDENGDWIIDHPNLPKQEYTNEAGIQALNSRLFPSELREKTLNKRFRYLQIIGIGIAAIGGLITIGTFLYKFIKGFLK